MLYKVGLQFVHNCGQRVRHSKETRAAFKQASSAWPREVSTREEAERLRASLPPELQAVTEVYEFIYL